MTEEKAKARYVIDTSVALKWFVETEETDWQKARRLRGAFLEGLCVLRAPELLPLELANALQLGRRLGPPEIAMALDSLRELGSFLEVFHWGTLAKAVEIAMSCHATVYDAYFLAMALESDSLLVTADEAFIRRVRRYPCVIALSKLRLPG